MLCNRSLKQRAINLSSCDAEFHTASACAGELLVLAELVKEFHCKVSVRLQMDAESARHVLQRRGPGGLKRNEIRCFSMQRWIREKRLFVGRRGYEKQYSRSLHIFKRSHERCRYPRNLDCISLVEQVCQYPHVPTVDRMHMRLLFSLC